MPIPLAAVGPAIGAGAGIVGMIRGSQKETLKSLEEAKRAAEGMEVPEEQALRYNIELLKNMGQLTPEMEQEILQEASGMRHISTDPALRQAQMAALTNLERRGKEGLTLEDRAAQEDIQRGIQQEQRAAQEAVMQNMQARGQLGSGGELAARLSASQSGMDAARQQGTDLARQVAASRLQAQMSAGQMGGDIRGQDFSEQSAKAQAQDLINAFNTQGQRGVQSTNVRAKNLAQAENLDYAKQLEANRADTKNRQAQMNIDAYTQALGARNLKRAGIVSASKNIASSKDQQFADRIAGAQKIGSSLSPMGAALGGGGAAPATGAVQPDAAGGTTEYSKDYLKKY